MRRAYHLNLDEGQIRGSRIVLLPGDPFRVSKIAGEVKKKFGGDIEEVAWKREYKTMLCQIKQKPVLITST
ncbi:MAG: nucleoside phosphorylase, partial [Nitrospira sp.]|nr:nucleoside phosphorylase [Nitrospira sp.]